MPQSESVSCSVMSDSLQPWTATNHALLSMEFSRQQCRSRLPFPSPGNLPNPGMNPGLLHCRQIFYYLSHKGSHKGSSTTHHYYCFKQ